MLSHIFFSVFIFKNQKFKLEKNFEAEILHYPTSGNKIFKIAYLIELFDYPFSYIQNWTFPSLHQNSSQSMKTITTHSNCKLFCYDKMLYKIIGVLFISIIYITVLSTALIHFAKNIVSTLGIEGSTLGATFVALGAQIPDIFNSIALARAGLFDAAMSNAIGSQVINVSLGIGLPMIVSCMLSQGEVYIAEDNSQSLSLLSLLLFIIVFVYIINTLPILDFLICKFNKTTILSKNGSIILLLSFFLSHIIYFLKNELS